MEKIIDETNNGGNKLIKTFFALLVFLLFMFAQGAVVVTGCVDGHYAVWARAGILWGLVAATLIYFFAKYKNLAGIGFGRGVQGVAKDLLYYIPLLAISLLYFTTGLNLGEGSYYIIANLFLTLAIGMAEEIYFRGIIGVIWLCKGKNKAMIISAVLFALCHMLNVIGGADFYLTLLQICFAFVYGMVFAILYFKGKSLVPLVLLHAFHDFCCYLSKGGTIRFNTLLAVIQACILVVYFIYLIRFLGYNREEKERL